MPERRRARAGGGRAATAKAIDELVSKSYPADGPGASVVVIKEGRTLLRKGYGMADMELGVGVEPDMVFRLGSITKQFTAVAILMLAEQGKLSLTDDIQKFFPDFPTKGRAVTVEHLLTHTSGIKSYTSIPAWLSMWRRDMTVAELIDLFKKAVDAEVEFQTDAEGKVTGLVLRQGGRDAPAKKVK